MYKCGYGVKVCRDVDNYRAETNGMAYQSVMLRSSDEKQMLYFTLAVFGNGTHYCLSNNQRLFDIVYPALYP